MKNLDTRSSGRRRFLGRLMAFALPPLVLFPGFTAYIANSFLHPGRVRVRGKLPADVPVEKVRFTSSADGLTLDGWLIPAEGRAKGAIVLCHGRSENREQMLPHALYLRRAGFTCLLFDFRCCGESGGDTSTLGWKETDDVLGAVAYLRSRPDTRDLPMGGYGISMGGAALLQAAARTEALAVLGTDCTYAALPRAIDQRFRALLRESHPILSVPVRFLGEQMSGLRADTVSPLEAVKKLGPRPLLLIHGKKDITILPEDSQMLYNAATGPRELWLLENVAHARAYSAQPEEYRRRVTAFFQKYLSAPAIAEAR